MNRCLACLLLAAGILAARPAGAQPALDRLEQRIRQQVQLANPPVVKQPGYLGLVADDRDDRGRGARLVEVVADGPAAKAGLKVGDLITSVSDQPVRDLDSMQRLLETRTAGAVVMITITRDGGNRQIPVTLGERPPADKRRLPQFGKQPDELPPPAGAPAADGASDNLVLRPGRPLLGIRTLPITAESQQQYGLPSLAGALVNFVNPGSAAEKAGVPIGAAIVAIDGKAVDSPLALSEIIRQLKIGATVDLTCLVRGQELHKRVVLAAAAPQSETRAKPPIGAAPADVPAAPPPGFVPQDAPGFAPALVPGGDDARIDALERRVAELEARLEKLEAQAAGK